MGSKFGAKRGMPGYDRFRTGLKYRQVYKMMKDWTYKGCHKVLGFWHKLKMELWERYQDEKEAKADGGET